MSLSAAANLERMPGHGPSMKDRTYLPLLLLLPLAALLLFLIREYQVAGTFGFPLDDSWIFWVFARNLATGNGFSFNPGQAILGTTSILWVLVLSGSYLITQHVVLISKLWGVIFFLASVLLTYRICLFHTRSRMVAFAGTMTFALAPALIFGALSGMEISLGTFLFCLTLYFHLSEKGKDRRVFASAIFGALCFLARPELITLYPLLLVHDYVRTGRNPDHDGSGVLPTLIVRKLVVFLVSLGLCLFFSRLLTGSLLPNTLAAKTLDSGIIWAIKNGNLHEIIISLSLNPVVWVGCMLALLVRLNIFWAFFWSNGAVLSLLRRDTFIYPVIFLAVPMVRGIVAPISNPFLGAHRYVSFLFPLLAVIFVIGWSGMGGRLRTKFPNASLKKWLLLIAGCSLLLFLVFYTRPLVERGALVSFFTRYYFPELPDRSAWTSLADFKYLSWFSVFFIALVSLLGMARFFSHRAAGRRIMFALLMAGAVLQIGTLVSRSRHYALSIKNINEMEVHLGKWISRNLPQGSLVAINDVGAIKFYGDRRCLDLEGLVSPEVIPYKMLGAESYVVYLNEHRPDYFVIFPAWYPPLMSFLSLKEGILYEIQLEDNVAVGGAGHTIVAKPDWEFFDNALQNSGLLEIEPYLPKKSFRRRWFDGQERQGVFPDWKVFQIRGRQAELSGDSDAAEELYRKAESYEPQHHEFYMQMAVFYERKGDHLRATAALRKSTQYQLFPPPVDPL
jgi:hypothetical protein